MRRRHINGSSALWISGLLFWGMGCQYDEPAEDTSAADASVAVPDASSPPADDRDEEGPAPDGGAPVDLPRCDALNCTGISGNRCLAGLCVSGSFADIAFAEEHACLIARAPGPVFCLGANDRGELGDGTRISSDQFTRVVGIEDAVRIWAGRHHNCALTVEGALRCWGANDAGQCGVAGDPDAPVEGADALEPILVTLAGATEVALGTNHTCVRAGAEVSCFGGNDQGQLGDGTAVTRADPGWLLSTTAVALGAGDGTTCLLDTDGAVACAGRNDQGQLDGQPGAGRSVLVELESAGPFTALAVGDAFACAATVSGGVRCWGANDVGQLGSGAVGPIAGLVTPALGGGVVTGLLAGARHVLALDGGGPPWAWGDNASQEVSFGGWTEPNAPTPRALPLVVVLRIVTGGTTTFGQDALGEYFFGALAGRILGVPGPIGGDA